MAAPHAPRSKQRPPQSSNSFDEHKRLSLLPFTSSVHDKSPKGSIDLPIRELCHLINSHPDYYTTSTCSGRICVFERLGQGKGNVNIDSAATVDDAAIDEEPPDSSPPPPAPAPASFSSSFSPPSTSSSPPSVSSSLTNGKGTTGRWLLSHHRPITLSELVSALQAASSPTTSCISFRHEPLLLHVACRNLEAGLRLLSCCQACGFRESGLLQTSSNDTSEAKQQQQQQNHMRRRTPQGDVAADGVSGSSSSSSFSSTAFVAIRSYALAMSTPLWPDLLLPVGSASDPSSSRCSSCSGGSGDFGREVLSRLVQEANGRFADNERKLERLTKALSGKLGQQVGGGRGDDQLNVARLKASWEPLPPLNLRSAVCFVLPTADDASSSSSSSIAGSSVAMYAFGGFGPGPQLPGSSKAPSPRRQNSVFVLHRRNGVFSRTWEPLSPSPSSSPSAALPPPAMDKSKGCVLPLVDAFSADGRVATGGGRSRPRSAVVAFFGGRESPSCPSDQLLLYDVTANMFEVVDALRVKGKHPLQKPEDVPKGRWNHTFTPLSGRNGCLAVLVGGRGADDAPLNDDRIFVLRCSSEEDDGNAYLNSTATTSPDESPKSTPPRKTLSERLYWTSHQLPSPPNEAAGCVSKLTLHSAIMLPSAGAPADRVIIFGGVTSDPKHVLFSTHEACDVETGEGDSAARGIIRCAIDVYVATGCVVFVPKTAIGAPADLAIGTLVAGCAASATSAPTDGGGSSSSNALSGTRLVAIFGGLTAALGEISPRHQQGDGSNKKGKTNRGPSPPLELLHCDNPAVLRQVAITHDLPSDVDGGALQMCFGSCVDSCCVKLPENVELGPSGEGDDCSSPIAEFAVLGGGVGCFAFRPEFFTGYVVRVFAEDEREGNGEQQEQHKQQANGKATSSASPKILQSLSSGGQSQSHVGVATTCLVTAHNAKTLKTHFEIAKLLDRNFRIGGAEAAGADKGDSANTAAKEERIMAIPVFGDKLRAAMERDPKPEWATLVLGIREQVVPLNKLVILDSPSLSPTAPFLSTHSQAFPALTRDAKQMTLVQRVVVSRYYAYHAAVSSTSSSSPPPDTLLLEQILDDQTLCPKSLERLGDDVLVVPAKAFLPLDSVADSALKRGLWGRDEKTGLDDGNNPFWKDLAEKHKCRRVVRRGEIDPSSPIRHSGHRLIYPPEKASLHPTNDPSSPTWVTVVEHGISQSFDMSLCMFSRGNISEKARFASLVNPGDVVLDMYAGIGYYTLPAIAGPNGKAAFVHSCEWNEDAVKALRHNLAANGVADRCEVHPGDSRSSAKKLKGCIDRVSLGLLPSSEGGWEDAVHALRPRGGWLHVHANVASAEVPAWTVWCGASVLRIARKMEGRGTWGAVVRRVEVVKSFAPKVLHVVADVFLGDDGKEPFLNAVVQNGKILVFGSSSGGGSGKGGAETVINTHDVEEETVVPSCALTDDGLFKNQRWMFKKEEEGVGDD